MAEVVPGSTEAEAPTADADGTSVFESLLSEDPEYREESSTTPPAKQSPKPESEPDDQEADPEPAESDKDESQEQEDPDGEEGQEPPAGLDPSTKVRLKIDGQDVEVTLDEALKGYSRTQDYTRKTQELAQHRKAFETEVQSARQERATLAQNLKLVEQALEEMNPKEPDWEQVRREQGPEKMADLYIRFQEAKKEREAVTAMREEAEKKVREDQQHAMQDRMVAERDLLFQAVPEWKDEAVRTKDKAEMKAFAESLGYTEADLAQVVDHRVFLLLRDAMKYRQTQQKKVEAVKRIEVVKTTKPSGETTSRPPVSDKTRALQRLAKTRHQRDLAGVFETILPDDL